MVRVVLSVRSLSIDADTGVDTGVIGAAATGEVTCETVLPMCWRTTRESVEPCVLLSDVLSMLPSDEEPSELPSEEPSELPSEEPSVFPVDPYQSKPIIYAQIQPHLKYCPLIKYL